MYCPICFSNSLKLLSHGVLTISLNGRDHSASHFLFNVLKQDNKELENLLFDKLTDFFDWYKDLKNAGPIKEIEIYSSDFVCESGCKLDPKFKHSVVNILFSQERVVELLNGLGKEYHILIELENDIFNERKHTQKKRA